MKTIRNAGLHTSAEQARSNILIGGLRCGATSVARLMAKSQMGRLAFPAYNFKRPQGAAFAVAKIVRHLEDDGLVRWDSSEDRGTSGYRLTLKGMAVAQALVTEGCHKTGLSAAGGE